MKKLLSILMLLVAIVTGAKADNTYSFGYNQAILDSYDSDGTLLSTVGHDGSVIDLSSTYSSLGDAYVTSTSSKEKCLSISNDASQNYDTYYLEIKSTEEIKSIYLVAAVTGGTSGSSAVAVGWTDTPGATITEYQTFTTPGKGDTKGKEITITFTKSGIKYVRLYRKIKLDSATKTTFTNSSATTIPSSASTYGISFIKVTTKASAPAGPSISADDVNISKDATSEGEISFSVSNPVAGGEVTADTEADWLTLGTVDNTNGKVPFTATANTGAERSATVTLTYTYNTSETVTKEVTVTQAAPTFAITYNKGTYGTGSIAPGEKSYGVDFILSSDKFTRENYTQTGWATTDGGEKAYDLGGTYSDNAAIELFPVWEAIEFYTQIPVTAAYKWDWSKLSPVSELTASTTPSNAEDFVMANMDGVRYTQNLGFNTNFTLEAARAIVISNTQWVRRSGDGDAFQNGTIKMNFAVPGTLKIEFSGTSGSGQTDRYLVVNGEQGSVATAASNKKEETFSVSGETTISFLEGKPLRIYTLEFTPFASQDITVGTSGFATVGLPFATTVPEGVTAYAVSAVAGSKVTMSSAIAEGTTVPANKGFVIVAAPGDYTFTEVAEAEYEGDNLLEAVGATPKAATTEAPIYVLAITGERKVGFKKATSGSLGAYKAYLPGTVSTQNTLSVSFDDETAVEAIAEANEADAAAPVKVVKNGQLFIGDFNVAGQQVK